MDDLTQKMLANLKTLSKRLELNEYCQITSLLPVKRLVKNNNTTPYYYLYLLERSYDYHQSDQSLSTVRLITQREKSDLYLITIETLKSYIRFKTNKKHEKKLLEIYNCLQRQFPGWKRLSINATRRKIKDPDLLLIEQTLQYILNNYLNGSAAYKLSQYFCSDYKHFRLELSRQSSTRVNDIAQYLFSCNT